MNFTRKNKKNFASDFFFVIPKENVPYSLLFLQDFDFAKKFLNTFCQSNFKIGEKTCV